MSRRYSEYRILSQVGKAHSMSIHAADLSPNATLEQLARERIAVCMVGAARTLILDAVHNSIKSNLLDAQVQADQAGT